MLLAASCNETPSAPPDAWTASDPGITVGESEGDENDENDEVPLDVGTPGGSSAAPGCRSIDVLFVIDNSSSMAQQQWRLLSAFSGFVDGITDTLADVDSYHVGVVTSDAYAFNAAGCNSLGDLVTKTGGEDSANESCSPMLGDRRYATLDDDLDQAFPCMAKVGTEGSSQEQPISAAVAALDPDKLEPGGCNEGFLRDDAILVLVIVTDDPPFAGDLDDAHPDGGDVADWHDAIVAAKHGDEAATVVIGFVPYDDVRCMALERESPNAIDFVSSFGEQGFLESVCYGSYSRVFGDAIATIHSTCEDFVPVG